MTKILHIFHDYLPVTQNWSYRMIKNLPDCEVYVAAVNIRKNAFHDPAFHYLYNPKQWLINFQKSTKKKSIWFPIKRIIAKYLRTKKPYQRYLETAIPSSKIDIIHAHFADLAYSYAPVVKKVGVPFVVSYYGLDYEFIPHARPEFVEYYQQLFKEADLFVCEGRHGAKMLEKMGCPKEKITVSRLGVEPKKVTFLERVKKAGSLNLVQIASYREKKGHRYSLQAFKKALETCPNMTLTLVGGSKGAIKDWVDNFIKKNKLEEKVIQIDRIDFSKLYDFLAKYDVFIHPSCYANNMDCEGGAPVVLLDAQATGMPVVATKHCDIPDEVVDGKTGLLANEKDIKGIAAAIKRFYGMEQEEFNSFAKNGRLHVEKDYDIQKNAAELRAAYDRLLAR